MKFLFALALAVTGICAKADVMSCQGKGLRLQLILAENGKAEGPRHVQATDKTIERDIRISAKNEVWGPEKSTVASLPVYYQGEFPSPSSGYTGQWQLIWNPATGRAELDWDDDDGGFQSFDLTCSVTK